MDIRQNIAAIRTHIPADVTLVCVSKFHPAEMICEAYEAGERVFGESRVQELCAKQAVLPTDIRWHMIGHLQRNKVREIIPFISLIESVDSLRLLDEIEKEAARIDRIVDVLLEVHVAGEESKTGFLPAELPTDAELAQWPHVRVRGIMGMATNTEDETEIRRCFRQLRSLNRWSVLSMGMSEDYRLAIEEGSTMVRIGSSIFGERQY